MIQPGISLLLTERGDLLAGRRMAVLTNHTGVLPDLSSSLDALMRAADVRAIFSPEHGFYGVAAPGAHVTDSTYRHVPVHSLYGAHVEPSPEQLSGIDAVICDVQDIGCRFYTYVWTLVKVMQAAARRHVAIIIADRPNPLGGTSEGPGVEQSRQSLVGLHDVPVRHGLTIGELARLVNEEARLGCDLTVVPCAGWSRSMDFRATGLPWVPPSPNMPTAETALLYPGTCLIEGVNVSLGRGTARPFEWVGAPWINGAALAEELNALDLPGVRWRPVVFQPLAEPYTGEICAGVQAHVVDSRALRPVALGVALVQTIWRLYPSLLEWHAAHFDRLAGSASIRAAITRGASLAEITASWHSYTKHFHARAAAVTLYGSAGPPFPS
jgi:uncharacterized protein YbbC (DUF1343 family)